MMAHVWRLPLGVVRSYLALVGKSVNGDVVDEFEESKPVESKKLDSSADASEKEEKFLL